MRIFIHSNAVRITAVAVVVTAAAGGFEEVPYVEPHFESDEPLSPCRHRLLSRSHKTGHLGLRGLGCVPSSERRTREATAAATAEVNQATIDDQETQQSPPGRSIDDIIQAYERMEPISGEDFERFFAEVEGERRERAKARRATALQADPLRQEVVAFLGGDPLGGWGGGGGGGGGGSVYTGPHSSQYERSFWP